MWDFVIEDKKPVKSEDETAAAFEFKEAVKVPMRYGRHCSGFLRRRTSKLTSSSSSSSRLI